MDGKLDGDVRDPEKRRPLLATEELFEDHHLRSLRVSAPAGAPQLPPYLVPQTGAQLCRLPRYRLLGPVTDDDLTSEEGRRAEAEAWRAASGASVVYRWDAGRAEASCHLGRGLFAAPCEPDEVAMLPPPPQWALTLVAFQPVPILVGEGWAEVHCYGP